MEWKTLATLALALTSAVVGAKFPEARDVAFGIATFCIGLMVKQPKTWFAGSDPKAMPKVEEPPK